MGKKSTILPTATGGTNNGMVKNYTTNAMKYIHQKECRLKHYTSNLAPPPYFFPTMLNSGQYGTHSSLEGKLWRPAQLPLCSVLGKEGGVGNWAQAQVIIKQSLEAQILFFLFYIGPSVMGSG